MVWVGLAIVAGALVGVLIRWRVRRLDHRRPEEASNSTPTVWWLIPLVAASWGWLTWRLLDAPWPILTLWLPLSAALAWLAAVDLSGQVYAQQHARDIAAQAARTAGQQIDASRGVRGIGAQTNTAQAIAAATSYIAAAGMEGDASITGGGTTITVSVVDTYETKFLSIIGLTSLRVTGSAETRVVRVVGGVER